MTLSRSLRWTCRLLDIIVPGIGSLLAGAPLRGALALSLWVAGVVMLIVSVPVFLVHPLRAVALLAIVWVTAATLLNLGPQGSGPPRRRAALAGALAAVAIVFTVLIVCGHFFTLTRIPGLGMFPGLLPGEVVLVARPAAIRDGPQRGELWFGRADNGVALGRIAAFPGEQIRVDGADLSIDERPVEAEPLGKVEMRTDVPVPRREFEALEVFTEELGGMRHLGFHRRGVLAAPTDAEVPEDTVFLLADNRSTADPGDSRQFGPVPIDGLIGRALLVVWSPGDDESPPRLDRIGTWWP